MGNQRSNSICKVPKFACSHSIPPNSACIFRKKVFMSGFNLIRAGQCAWACRLTVHSLPPFDQFSGLYQPLIRLIKSGMTRIYQSNYPKVINLVQNICFFLSLNKIITIINGQELHPTPSQSYTKHISKTSLNIHTSSLAGLARPFISGGSFLRQIQKDPMDRGILNC